MLDGGREGLGINEGGTANGFFWRGMMKMFKIVMVAQCCEYSRNH